MPSAAQPNPAPTPMTSRGGATSRLISRSPSSDGLAQAYAEGRLFAGKSTLIGGGANSRWFVRSTEDSIRFGPVGKR